MKNRLVLFYDYEEGPHDVVVCTGEPGEPARQIKVIFRDVTAEAADKLVAKFDLVDLDDLDQVMAIQKEIMRTAPQSYSWHIMQMRQRQAQNQPARRVNGQFKSMGATS